jgi:hypothetical protein
MDGGSEIQLAGDPDDRRAVMLALLSLAVRRSEPMLAMSSLPRAIVESPEQLRKLAGRAILADRATRDDKQGGKVASVDGGDAASVFLRSVAETYDPRTASDLGDWLRCLHVDRAHRNRLAAWGTVLQLAAAKRPLMLRAPDLDPAVRLVLADSAERAFGPIANADLERVIAAASQIPLTSSEERLLAMEVSQIGDVDQWDVIQDMELNATLSSARTARAELKARLTPAQFETVLDWARKLLERRGDAFGAKLLESDRDCGEAAVLRQSSRHS